MTALAIIFLLYCSKGCFDYLGDLVDMKAHHPKTYENWKSAPFGVRLYITLEVIFRWPIRYLDRFKKED